VTCFCDCLAKIWVVNLRLDDWFREIEHDEVDEAIISKKAKMRLETANEVTRQETRDFFRSAAAAFSPARFAEALSAIPDVPVPRSDRIK